MNLQSFMSLFKSKQEEPVSFDDELTQFMHNVKAEVDRVQKSCDEMCNKRLAHVKGMVTKQVRDMEAKFAQLEKKFKDKADPK